MTDGTTDNKKMNELLDKQLGRTASFEEQQQLADYLSSADEETLDDVASLAWKTHTPKESLSDERSQQILSAILTDESAVRAKKRRTTRLWLRATVVAASIMLVALIGVNYLEKTNPRRHYVMIAKAVEVSASQPVLFSRHLTLPDGSTVILKKGSRLIYPSSFAGKTREVTLQGEAFFDIHHNARQPFVIRTGNVKTTVLGTAFNIKVYRNEVVVSVTRGRVRVEKNGAQIAELGVNEEVSCSTVNNEEKKQSVDTGETLSWTKQDMEFDHTPMIVVAQTLSQRYGVNISVNNVELEKLIFVSNFTGTESLDEVLTVLCSLMPDMSFKIEGNNVSIMSKTK